jgi:hypothetical protein
MPLSKINERLVYQLTWVVIHVTARAMTRDRAVGFIVFIEGLTDLFPIHDVRDTLSAFLKDNPLDPNGSVFENSRSVFDWTYRLHNYATFERSKRCGRPAILMPTSIDQVWDQYGADKFPNNSWGKPYWFLMHYMAANLPPQLTERQFLQWGAFIRGLNEGLPCVICRKHMTQFLTKHQLKTTTGIYRSGLNCWQWTTTLHNEVNARLSKTQLGAQQLEELRQSLLVEPGLASGSLICPI